MKKRSSLGYLLIFPTLSLYLLFWLFYMMRDINELSGEEVFSPGKTFKSLCIYYFLILGSSGAISYLVETRVLGDALGLYIALYGVASVIFVRWVYLIFTIIDKIGKSISQLQIRFHITDRYSPDLIFFLTAFAWISVPYLQEKVNRIIDITREAEQAHHG